MSHRKIRSHGSIPFSWEEKPGIPKLINHKKSASDLVLNGHKIIIPDDNDGDYLSDSSSKINPPPPCRQYSRSRAKSFSTKWWQDDPFLAALRSCSKSSTTANIDLGHKRNHEPIKGKNSFNMKSSVFSCKHSCNVENDNLINFTKLPPLPKERHKVKPFVVKRPEY